MTTRVTTANADVSITAVDTYLLGDGSDYSSSQMGIELVAGTTITAAFECSIGGSAWVALNAFPSNSTTPVTSTTTAGIWRVDSSLVKVRLNVTVITGTWTLQYRPGIG